MSCRSLSKVLFVFVLVCATGAAVAGPMLVRVGARNYSELAAAITFKGTSIDIAGAKAGVSYDLLLDRADFARVQGCGLPVTVVYDDVDTRKGELAQDGQYHSYAELLTMMRGWATDYPSICQLESIGPTYQSHWIYGVKIASSLSAGKPECLELGVVHAREWAGVEAVRYLADTLIRFYATDPGFQSFVDNHQLYVFMVTNVDGYMYDYPGQLYWRKDRQPFGSDIGCDPNRDFNGSCMGSRFDDWGALGSGTRSSHDPSDETFMGGTGAWGLEIKAVSDWFKQHTVVACISMHTYSELVLWPFGTGTIAPDNSYLSTLATNMASRMAALGGGTYTPEQSNYLYPTNDGSDDWFYGWAHTIGGFPCMSFTTELGTDFYQPTADLNSIQRESFKGDFYLFQHSDSIIADLEGMVPRPILAVMDSSSTGDFTLHWTPTRPDQNHPDVWEVEELTGLSVATDDIESGSGKWDLQGATVSTTQKHSGASSLYLGTGNNISNYAVTHDPYPVQAGDSLTYWIWYNTENGYDVTVAEVSLEGKEWFQLHDRFTGNSSGWLRKAWSLAPWVGKSVFIRFRYMTDDGTTNSGVYIDDVRPVPAFATRTTIATNVMDTMYAVTGKDPGQYWYRVRGHNTAWGWSDKGPLEDILVTGTGIAQERPARVAAANAVAVEPNPVRGSAVVRFSLSNAGNAQVSVYDAGGRLVNTLSSGARAAGEHRVAWNGTDAGGALVPAGVYFVRLTGDASAACRVAVIR